MWFSQSGDFWTGAHCGKFSNYVTDFESEVKLHTTLTLSAEHGNNDNIIVL